MPDVNVKTIGTAAQSQHTITFDTSRFYSTGGEDGVVFINCDKEKNENRIVEELNNLILQEENLPTAHNISRIQELLSMLPFEEKRIEMTYRKNEILKLLKAEIEIQHIENNINDENNITKVEDIFSLMNKYMVMNKINKNDILKQIDIELIENNFVDYINLGQRIRKKALTMFMEKSNKKYTTIAEVNNDLDVIVKEFKRRDYATDIIEINPRG